MEGGNFFEVRKRGESVISSEESGDKEGEWEEDSERDGEWMAMERLVEIFGRDCEWAQVAEEFFGGVDFSIRVVASADSMAVGCVESGGNVGGVERVWGCRCGVEGMRANEEIDFHLQLESDFVFTLSRSAST